MRHGTKKYNSIQDTSKNPRIPKDEPVFLIRGQDKLAPNILRAYVELYEALGGSKAIVAEIKSQSYKMEEWQASTGVCKIAD